MAKKLSDKELNHEWELEFGGEEPGANLEAAKKRRPRISKSSGEVFTIDDVVSEYSSRVINDPKELRQGTSHSEAILDLNELMEKGILKHGGQIDLSKMPKIRGVQVATQEQLDMLTPKSREQITTVYLSNNTPVGWNNDYNFNNQHMMDEVLDLRAYKKLSRVETIFYLNNDLRDILLPSGVGELMCRYSKMENFRIIVGGQKTKVTLDHAETSFARDDAAISKGAVKRFFAKQTKKRKEQESNAGEDDLAYLNDMYEQAYTRIFTKKELDKIKSAFLNQVDTNDAAEALQLTSEIVIAQSGEKGIENLRGLVDRVMYVGESMGETKTVERMRRIEVKIAAELLDKGRYGEFEEMMAEGFDPFYTHDAWRKEESLMNEVKTLAGVKYLDKKGLIPAGYFTEYKNLPPLCYASAEQVDFYIEHGADAKAKSKRRDSILDHAINNWYPSEYIEKIYNAGGRMENPDGKLEYMLNPMTIDYIQEFAGDKGVENNLRSATWFIKEGIAKRPTDMDWLLSSEYCGKHPDAMRELFAGDKNAEAQIALAQEQEDARLKAAHQEKFENALQEARKHLRPRIKPTVQTTKSKPKNGRQAPRTRA